MILPILETIRSNELENIGNGREVIIMEIDLREHIFHIEKEHKSKNRVDPYQQKYHIMPPVGGIYEPSGLCDCDGDYYVFIQYSPMEVERRGQCFSLYKSRDLLHFLYVGVPIISDQSIDKDGVFSGSTLLVGKEMYFYYTGKVDSLDLKDEDYEEGEYHTIVVKITKDSYFNDVYSDKLVVLKSTDYKEIASGRVSGPKVWQDNGVYHMVHALRTKEQTGAILFFTSSDKINWKYKKKLVIEEDYQIFECPDLFYLERVPILSVSMFHDGDKDMCNKENDKSIYKTEHNLIQNKVEKHKSFFTFLQGESIEEYCVGELQEWDYGFDFYAPQTFMDRNERVIMIALMGNPGSAYRNPTIELGWQHCLTIPRELEIREGQLYQNPISEIERQRKNQNSIVITKEADIRLKNSSDFVLNLPKESEGFNLDVNNTLRMYYDCKKQLFGMEFINSMGYGREKRETSINRLTEVRILFDSSSIEIFLNKGEVALTTRMFKKEKDYSLKLSSVGAKLTWWDIEL